MNLFHKKKNLHNYQVNEFNSTFTQKLKNKIKKGAHMIAFGNIALPSNKQRNLKVPPGRFRKTTFWSKVQVAGSM